MFMFLFSMQNETSESYTPPFENDVPVFGSDANGNFLESCSRYANAATDGGDDNVAAPSHPNEFTRIENDYITNYPSKFAAFTNVILDRYVIRSAAPLFEDVDVNFLNTSNEFSGGDRSASSHSVHEVAQAEPPCMIMDFAPEWSYCEVSSNVRYYALLSIFVVCAK